MTEDNPELRRQNEEFLFVEWFKCFTNNVVLDNPEWAEKCGIKGEAGKYSGSVDATKTLIITAVSQVLGGLIANMGATEDIVLPVLNKLIDEFMAEKNKLVKSRIILPRH